MKPSKTLLVLGNPVAFYPGIVPITGSIKATLMFCQIFYWFQRTENPLGVYKSVQDFENEIHLTYKEQIAARKKLSELGLITEEYDRANHRVYFAVDTERLDELLFQQELAHDQKAHAKKEGGTCQKVSYHLTKSKVGNTETTAKTTTKTKSICLSDYISSCEAKGEKPIPDGHPSRRYAEGAGIHPDMLAIMWFWFLEHYTEGTGKQKKYIDWGATFTNAVKGNWGKLWGVSRETGAAYWTSEGMAFKTYIDAKLGN